MDIGHLCLSCPFLLGLIGKGQVTEVGVGDINIPMPVA